ncbi:uncharacterized protein LOC141827233 [Curcuma longa]|uniref:uncharacterized protein LOC141827233 n=1 Tax=Curcuma longa TaxID=136217 RepID=UPI003D9EDA3B
MHPPSGWTCVQAKAVECKLLGVQAVQGVHAGTKGLGVAGRLIQDDKVHTKGKSQASQKEVDVASKVASEAEQVDQSNEIDVEIPNDVADDVEVLSSPHTGRGSPSPPPPPPLPVEREEAAPADGGQQAVPAGGGQQAGRQEPPAQQQADRQGAAERENQQPMRRNWASLFKDNRTVKQAKGLDQYEAKGERLQFNYEDIDTVEDSVGYCLVGCFMGRHPGREGVVKVGSKWPSYQFFMHKSGWVVFRFDKEEDRETVLQGGPYFVFGIPLFLKKMPKCFMFEEDGRFVPAWIQIHGLPPDCWSQFVLSKVGSEVGKPLYTDSLTRTRERLGYARLMVEIPTFEDRIHEVPITLPTGVQVDLKIIYETTPAFCQKCNRMGHDTEACQGGAVPTGQQHARAEQGRQTDPNAPKAWRNRSQSARGRRRTRSRYRPRTRSQWRPRQQQANVGEHEEHVGLEMVLAGSPIPVAIVPPENEQEEQQEVPRETEQVQPPQVVQQPTISSEGSSSSSFVSSSTASQEDGAARETIHMPAMVINEGCILEYKGLSQAPKTWRGAATPSAKRHSSNGVNGNKTQGRVIKSNIAKEVLRSFFVTFVYGLHSIVTRRPLWDALVDLGDNITDAWMVMGDFNSYLSIDEKKGGSPVTNHELRDMQNFTQVCGLVDLRSIGCRFTWTNGNVSCKLDRALVNSFWLMADFDAFAEFTAPGCLSDHSCTIVHTMSKDRPPNRAFKFINMWALHEDFEKIVKDSWAAPIQGHAQYILKGKMFRLKRCLRELNKNNFGHISEKAKRAKEELEEVQRSILDGGPPPIEYTQIRKKANLLIEAERQFYQQRAKNVYLKSADKCTKFFHDVVKRNNKRNAIITLKKRNGDQTTSINEVAEEFVDYFHGLLGKKEACTFLDSNEIDGRKLTLGQTEDLIKPVTIEEIKAALHDIGCGKAPGPDGYGSKFFTSSWDIIGNDFIAAVQEFFQSGKLLKQWNHSLISLVPKGDHAVGVADYRPISCCNVFYKVISKVLAARLSEVMDFLLDPAQVAFIKGRSIGDNIYLTQELLRKYARKRISPRCMIKVDLKKAFDMVDWDFLMSALVGFGFPQRYCNWIKECVTTVSYSISLNGGVYGFFSGQRGLRQDKIKALCRMFVWNSKCPPISWKKICLPRQDGGYGLRDLLAWNEALLSKILWNIKSKTDSLWIKWVHHHYIKGVDFWAWESKASDSPLIKRLIEIRNKILRTSSDVGSANMRMMDWFVGEDNGVKNAYNFFMPRGTEVAWKAMVWRPEIMPKHRFALWMLAQGRLRTKDRMEYEPNKECVMCRQQTESNQHVFFECPVTCELWCKVKQWLEIQHDFKSFEELHQIFGRYYKGRTLRMKARHLGISSSIYYVWEARNRCRFQNIAPDVNWLFRKVQIHVHRFVDAAQMLSVGTSSQTGRNGGQHAGG